MQSCEIGLPKRGMKSQSTNLKISGSCRAAASLRMSFFLKRANFWSDCQLKGAAFHHRYHQHSAANTESHPFLPC